MAHHRALHWREQTDCDRPVQVDALTAPSPPGPAALKKYRVTGGVESQVYIHRFFLYFFFLRFTRKRGRASLVLYASSRSVVRPVGDGVSSGAQLFDGQAVSIGKISAMEVQISTRQAMMDKLRRPFGSRRLNRMWSVVQMNLTRNSGYYALVSSLMCLCLIGLRTNVDYHDDIDAELHYHSWEPNVRYLLYSFMDPICIYPTYRRVLRLIICFLTPELISFFFHIFFHRAEASAG